MKDYFSHDYNARNDPKMVKLFMTHGVSGIGIYWCIVESLYESGGNIQKEEYERIAFELRIDTALVSSIIEGFKLFDTNEYSFWSNSVLKRLKLRKEKSEKARKSVQKRWNNTNVQRSNNDSNTIKVKESKVNKIKDIYNESFLLFWDEYPRRIGKGNAFKAWVKIKDDKQNIISAAKSYSEQCAKDKADDQFIPHPATWLNGRRWEDETKPITRNIPTRMIQ